MTSAFLITMSNQSLAAANVKILQLYNLT